MIFVIMVASAIFFLKTADLSSKLFSLFFKGNTKDFVFNVSFFSLFTV